MAADRRLRSGGMAEGPAVAAFEHESAESPVCGRGGVDTITGTAASHLLVHTLVLAILAAPD